MIYEELPAIGKYIFGLTMTFYPQWRTDIKKTEEYFLRKPIGTNSFLHHKIKVLFKTNITQARTTKKECAQDHSHFKFIKFTPC